MAGSFGKSAHGYSHRVSPDITLSWQMQIHMAWYTATGIYLLPEGPLRFAIQKHLGLPVFLPGQRCGYTPLQMSSPARAVQ